MHELITSVASLIILSMFVMQFAMCENLYLELTACDRVISEYEQHGFVGESALIDLETSLEAIPNVTAEVSDQKIELTIEKIVVPVWNKGDNYIKVVTELKHEEYDNYDGYSPPDEPAP